MVDAPGEWPHRGNDWVTQMRARAEPLGGSAEEIAEELLHYAALGVDHVLLWLDPISVAGIESFAPVLELIRNSEATR
jgi:alkanesulfonate monooxygenase SsuD/methylene tetrahydromethanopterin reductase-like flavin-dependent oxidoreductase (luciferase family)